jgi:hypothetical protein
VRASFAHQSPQLKAEHVSSREVKLTDGHIVKLKSFIPKFKAAKPNQRKKVIEDAAETIRKTWMEDSEFDLEIVISVYDLSAELDHSHLFLAR